MKEITEILLNLLSFIHNFGPIYCFETRKNWFCYRVVWDYGEIVDPLICASRQAVSPYYSATPILRA